MPIVPAFVICLSLMSSAASDPGLDVARGITGPEPAPALPTPLWMDERVWAMALVVIAVAVAVLAGRAGRPPAAPEPPPNEWAAAELDRLARLDAPASAAADRLAELLRGYLDRRYGLPAAGKTTAEVVALLTPFPPQTVADWRSLLERCDVTRFANAGFSTDDWAAALDQARSLTTESLPVGEVAGSAAARPVGEKA
jgi:hypothetical protein